MPDSPYSRKVLSRPRGDVLALQMRFRKEQEPDLFDLIMSLRKGTAANFLRLALHDAYRSGALTPHGYARTADEILRSLQIQLRMANEDNAALEQRVRLITAELLELKSTGHHTPVAPPKAQTVSSTPVAPAPEVLATAPPQPKEPATGSVPTPPERNIPWGFANALLSSQDE